MEQLRSCGLQITELLPSAFVIAELLCCWVLKLVIIAMSYSKGLKCIATDSEAGIYGLYLSIALQNSPRELHGWKAQFKAASS